MFQNKHNLIYIYDKNLLFITKFLAYLNKNATEVSQVESEHIRWQNGSPGVMNSNQTKYEEFNGNAREIKKTTKNVNSNMHSNTCDMIRYWLLCASTFFWSSTKSLVFPEKSLFFRGFALNDVDFKKSYDIKWNKKKQNRLTIWLI